MVSNIGHECDGNREGGELGRAGRRRNKGREKGVRPGEVSGRDKGRGNRDVGEGGEGVPGEETTEGGGRATKEKRAGKEEGKETG